MTCFRQKKVVFAKTNCFRCLVIAIKIMQILAFSLFYFDGDSLIKNFSKFKHFNSQYNLHQMMVWGFKSVRYIWKNIKFSTFCIFALKISNFRCFRAKIPNSKGMGHFPNLVEKSPVLTSWWTTTVTPEASQTY